MIDRVGQLWELTSVIGHGPPPIALIVRSVPPRSRGRDPYDTGKHTLATIVPGRGHGTGETWEVTESTFEAVEGSNGIWVRLG